MVLFILGTKTIQVIFGLSLGTKCFLFFFLTCLWDVYPQGMQEKVSVLPQIAHISSWLEGLEFLVIKKEMFPLENPALVALN